MVVTRDNLPSNGVTFTLLAELLEYYHTDVLGSVRMITNTSAQVVARFDQPYQELRKSVLA